MADCVKGWVLSLAFERWPFKTDEWILKMWDIFTTEY
jgi:hypothetical protein